MIIAQFGPSHGKHIKKIKIKRQNLYLTNYFPKKINIHFFLFVLRKLLEKLNYEFLLNIKQQLYIYSHNFFFKDVEKKLKDKEHFHTFTWANEAIFYKCKKLSIVTSIDCGIAHPKFNYLILKNEYKKFKIKYDMKNELRAAKEQSNQLYLSDKIVVPSEFVKKTFIKYGIDKKKITVIHMGVETDKFKPDKFKFKKHIDIAFSGQVGVRKGVYYLLKAVENLSKNENNFKIRLHLLGNVETGYQKILKKYENFFIQKKLSKLEISQYLKNMDLFVLPSLSEGMSRSILEAMACGIPCIVTPNVGYTDIIKNGYNGYVVPIKNSLAIENSIINYINLDLSKKKNMRFNARNSAKKYTWQKFIKKYEEYFFSLK